MNKKYFLVCISMIIIIGIIDGIGMAAIICWGFVIGLEVRRIIKEWSDKKWHKQH